MADRRNDRGPGRRPAEGDITRGLAELADGGRGALDRLMPLVFDELRMLARHHLARETPGHTLQPTALVNEVYLRLVGSRLGSIANRRHFFHIASRLIRQVLVDHARARDSRKRGGGAVKLSLSEVAGRAGEVGEAVGAAGSGLLGGGPAAAGSSAGGGPAADPETVLAVHEALERLEKIDRRQAELAELRFFVGLTIPEAAEVLGISHATAERDWAIARRRLGRELAGG